MKKLLIITYYWPPSGGSGVQRWLKFVKYLPVYGWEPHVFTPENPSFAVQDPSLEKDVPPEAEVIRFPIWEPYDLFFRIAGWFGSKKTATPTGLPAAEKRTFLQTISTWVRGNFFIPDPRRFWIRPSVKFLSEYLADNQIGVIVTTGPPHSVHMIGLDLKRRFSHLRWVADFRDPWSEWGLLDSLLVSKPVRGIHTKLERSVLSEADDVLTITPFYVRRFEALGKRKVELLTNGFDEDDFRSIHHEKTDAFIIRHVGVINEKCDPRPFLRALLAALQSDAAFAADVRMEFIGEVHPRVKSFVKEIKPLAQVTRFTGNIPHKQLLEVYGSSALLVLILTGYKDAEGYLPGKVFEYIATGLPVMGVGPVDGDAAEVLKDAGSGSMYDSVDEDGISAALIRAYHQWKGPAERVSPSDPNPSRYSRKAITGQLVKILDAG